MKGLIEERRRRPREDDLLTELVSAPAQGRQWSDDEITSVVVSIIIVGHHTTTAFIGNGIRALVDHPLQFARLRQAAVSAGAAEPPEIAESAVEELLRYDAPAQFVSRYAAQDLDLAGERIEAGQSALLFLGAANRDPTAFDAPESLDLTRKPNDHLAFSLGHAYCFGAPLARLAGQVFFSALARRVSRIAVESDPVPFDTIGLRGLSTLPVRTDAVA